MELSRVADQTSDKRLELAYDAAQKKLAMQDTTLGNVRTRANTLLATAALFTSFSAGIGLLNNDPTKGGLSVLRERRAADHRGPTRRLRLLRDLDSDGMALRALGVDHHGEHSS
jgi:hypothetical protein